MTEKKTHLATCVEGSSSHDEGGGISRPKKLTLKQIAQRSLDEGASTRPVSVLLPNMISETLTLSSPEKIIQDLSVSKDLTILRLREGVLRLVSATNKYKRRYIASVYEHTCRYKGDQSAVDGLREFIDYHTFLKVPKRVDCQSEEVLDLAFNFVFVFTNYITPNTQHRWYSGLRHYFLNEPNIERVKRLIITV